MSRSVRFLAFLALAVAVLGGLGYALGGGDGDSDDDATRGTVSDGSGGGAFLGAPSIQGAEESAGGASTTDAAAAPAPSGLPFDGGGALAGSSGLDRKIIQTASISLQAEDVGASFEAVGRIAASVGGFVASSNFYYEDTGEDDDQRQVATATVRVPADRLQEVLTQVRALGVKIDSEAANASDVTEEYSDLSARLRTLEATESQLFQLLGRAETIEEILLVQDRLNQVRYEIEQVTGRIQLLDNLTDLATLSVSLRPVVDVSAIGPRSDGVDLGAKVEEAWDDSIEFLGGIAGGVVTVVVFSWWLLPLAIPAAIVFARSGRGHPTTHTPTEAP
jgi:hypothetical protein